MNERRDGDGDDETLQALRRLGCVVEQRNNNEIWRSFLVAQATSREGSRRREMTTQRIFLLGQQER